MVKSLPVNFELHIYLFIYLFQISNKYDIPDEMIHFIYKKTKKG